MTRWAKELKLKTKVLKNNLETSEDNKESSIPSILADPYCRVILVATNLIPKSAMEINSDTKVPISTVYRRIQTLCDAGLLNTTGTITEEGKKFFLYKSTIKEISVKFNGSLEIKVVPNRI